MWDVLTDTDRYAEWNPFMTELSGRLAVGEHLSVTIRPGRRSMTFRPTVLAVEDGTLLRWRGRFLLPGILDGVHDLLLEPLPDGGTRFVQREVFSGLLVPFVRRVLDDTELGFAAMNAALRDGRSPGPPDRSSRDRRHGSGERADAQLEELRPVPASVARAARMISRPGRRSHPTWTMSSSNRPMILCGTHATSPAQTHAGAITADVLPTSGVRGSRP